MMFKKTALLALLCALVAFPAAADPGDELPTFSFESLTAWMGDMIALFDAIGPQNEPNGEPTDTDEIGPQHEPNGEPIAGDEIGPEIEPNGEPLSSDEIGPQIEPNG